MNYLIYNGNNGFRINGITVGDLSGISVNTAGDVNGDGLVDLIIGASGASANGEQSGQSYVIFGGSSEGTTGILELSNLDGINGFKINGINSYDNSGRSVACAGDINGDNIADLIIGAPSTTTNGINPGQSYVIFGGLDIGKSGSVQLSNLNGNNGFKINGINPGDNSGYSVSSAGDYNGDGVDDLVIGARSASPNGQWSGQSYVIFGGMSVGGSGTIQLSDLNGIDGFRLDGVSATVNYGRISVASAGDVNGDGLDDLIIGSAYVSPNRAESGQSYLIFGNANVTNSGTFELYNLNGNNGFKLNGVVSTRSGVSVASAGDINGDGVVDLIIGAYKADINGVFSGKSYVVFGGATVGSSGTIELIALDGSEGFSISGITSMDYSGHAVASAGDINGDGISDLIIGADRANPSGLSNSGQSYIIFGGTNISNSGTIELSNLNGNNGFMLNGVVQDGLSGFSVAPVGDVNNDGVDDVIVGAPGISQSYLIFGDFIKQLNLINNELSINQGQSIILSKNNLNATSNHYPDGNLQFIISNIKHGRFAFVPDPITSITKFYQQDVKDGQVQFIHDGSIYSPYYETSVFTGKWVFTPPQAANIDFGDLKLVNNELTIIQADSQLFNSTNLYATSINSLDNQIIFTIKGLQYGRFEAVSKPGITINEFTQQQVIESQIQFVTDGTPNVPKYNVIVCDRRYTLPPLSSTVEFYYLPDLINNGLTIQQGHTVVLNSGNLLATDRYIPELKLIFSISELQNGCFEFTTNAYVPIVEFTQAQINDGLVQFVSVDSRTSPSYKVTVKANNLASIPKAAHIHWIPKPLIDRTSRNVLIGVAITVGAFGTLVLSYIAMGFLKKRRLHAVSKNKQDSEADYYRETIIPLAEAIFKRIKVTGFMNYISSEQMEACVDAIASVVHEINQLGINIELQGMSAVQRTQLLNQIITKIQELLEITNESKRRCVSQFSHFFKPQVTPEEISNNAGAIANSVYDALFGEVKSTMTNTPLNVNLNDVVSISATDKMSTTSYVRLS